MTAHSPIDPPPAAPRGGAPVAHLADLDPVAAAAVLQLRAWGDGDGAAILRDFLRALGPGAGGRAAADLDQLCGLIARHGRRPLMRHGRSCRCVGADEACFATFVATAAEGAREDALLVAMLLVRPDFAPCLVGLAQQVGLALRRMALRGAVPDTGHEAHTTLH